MWFGLNGPLLSRAVWGRRGGSLRLIRGGVLLFCGRGRLVCRPYPKKDGLWVFWCLLWRGGGGQAEEPLEMGFALSTCLERCMHQGYWRWFSQTSSSREIRVIYGSMRGFKVSMPSRIYSFWICWVPRDEGRFRKKRETGLLTVDFALLFCIVAGCLGRGAHLAIFSWLLPWWCTRIIAACWISPGWSWCICGGRCWPSRGASSLS